MTKDEEDLNKKYTAMLSLKSEIINQIKENEHLVPIDKSGKRIYAQKASPTNLTVALLNL
jgi:hypothetical protein